MHRDLWYEYGYLYQLPAPIPVPPIHYIKAIKITSKHPIFNKSRRGIYYVYNKYMCIDCRSVGFGSSCIRGRKKRRGPAVAFLWRQKKYFSWKRGIHSLSAKVIHFVCRPAAETSWASFKIESKIHYNKIYAWPRGMYTPPHTHCISHVYAYYIPNT